MRYVVAIDQSTSGTKAALWDEQLHMVRTERRKHHQFYPAPGYAEHDAEEIWQNTAALLRSVTDGIDRKQIAGIGIANQRETTVLWERATGKPVCPAVVWQDVRAKPVTDRMQDCAELVFQKTGLRPSAYYSAAKAAYVLQNDDALMARALRGELCMGTVESYLLFRLTEEKCFLADVTNASRTQLLNIEKCTWDTELTELFRIPQTMLARQVLACDADFGAVTAIEELRGVPVRAMMGDSHASFLGHGCTKPGMVKASYGTGSSIMMNIGQTPKLSRSGLSTSIGYSFGGQTCYVLEGNVTCSADTLMWLRDDLKLIGSMEELSLAGEAADTGGVYLVPAFSGLGAPWFDENARAILCGMNRGTEKKHVVRAALASLAHQDADILDAMSADTGIPVRRLQADGGGSVNPILMQMQSDYTPCTVAVSAEQELTLRGIAILAGYRAGMFDPETLKTPISAVYEPVMTQEKRKIERNGWKDALRRCR